MTFPVDIHIGSARINVHFVFETLGMIVGFRYFLYTRKRTEDVIETGDRVWILIGAAIGALLLSRIAGALENPVLWAQNKANPLFYFTNKTIVGGLVGGLIGVEVIKKIIGVKSSSGDLFTFPIIISLIIGRIGCFLSGLEDFVYGVPTALPWGIDFGDGIHRHPVALYEIAFLGVLFFVLTQLRKRFVLENGSLFKLFMFFYFLFRFCIEYIKPVFVFSFGLSTIQLFCLAGLIYYYRIIATPKYLLKTG
jgi:phosphatidylglycerol:prolipoprotein diacylglycerol transferase